MLDRYPVTGIDVSDYQPRVRWDRVAQAGHKFAFVKSTEGNGWDAKLYREHYKGARGAGLLVGAYHFARWDGGNPDPVIDAREEALRFRDFVGEIGPGDLAPVLDLEWITGKKRPPEHMARWAYTFLETCDMLFGNRWSMTYIGPSFWRYCVEPAGADADMLRSWPLWIVDYNSTDKPKAMHGAPTWAGALADGWTFWQYTGHGRCPGVVDAQGSLVDCDLNVFNGTLNQLRALAGLEWLGSQAIAESDK